MGLDPAASDTRDDLDPYGKDIFTEAEGCVDTLSHLGPLARLAGVFESAGGLDDHPAEGGGEEEPYLERYECEPIDRQTNGPQLFYGLRYHTHVVKPGEVETFHDQVGYWLWEPAASRVLFSLAIPRGQALLAGGRCEEDASEFEVRAERGVSDYAIASNPFLERAFTTVRFVLRVTVHDEDSWSYEQETWLMVEGRDEPYRHLDRNRLTRVDRPRANPLAIGEAFPPRVRPA